MGGNTIQATFFRFSIGFLCLVVQAGIACRARAADRTATLRTAADGERKVQAVDSKILAYLRSAKWADEGTREIIKLFEAKFERCRGSLPESYRAILAKSVNDQLRHIKQQVDYCQIAEYKKARAEKDLIDLAGNLVPREGEPLPDAEERERGDQQFADLADEFGQYASSHPSGYGPKATELLITEMTAILNLHNTNFFSPAFGKKLDDSDVAFLRGALQDAVENLVATAEASEKQTGKGFRDNARSAISKSDIAFEMASRQHFAAFTRARNHPARRADAYAEWLVQTRSYRDKFNADLDRLGDAEHEASVKAFEDQIENDQKKSHDRREKRKASGGNREF